jgi:hypothetical protein
MLFEIKEVVDECASCDDALAAQSYRCCSVSVCPVEAISKSLNGFESCLRVFVYVGIGYQCFERGRSMRGDDDDSQ